MVKSKSQELVEELKTIFGGDNRAIEVILPSIIYLLVNRYIGLQWAIWLTLISSVIFFGYRLQHKQSIWYAVVGLFSAGLAAGITLLTGSSASYFLPGIITGGIAFTTAIITTLFQRPLAALSSHITRGWPIDWYWHPQIRPAYSEVSWGWALYFGIRFAVQGLSYTYGSTEFLGLIQLLGGWPILVLVLIASYLYGVWRLQNLNGPSVEEYKEGIPPPWEGQQRGF
jgi:hypothetical protein